MKVAATAGYGPLASVSNFEIHATAFYAFYAFYSHFPQSGVVSLGSVARRRKRSDSPGRSSDVTVF
jgi:hypothetical protein